MSDLIQAINLWGYDGLVDELGGHPRALRARFGIQPDIETRDDAFISYSGFIRLVEATATELGCADFGLRLSERQGLTILGPIAVIARNADTVQEAIAAIGRFMPVHSTAVRLGVGQPDGSGAIRLRYSIVSPAVAGLTQPYELAMGNAAQIIRLLSGGASGPAGIWIPHEPVSDADTYQRHLGCPVEFGAGWCGLAVARDVLDLDIDAADPQTRRVATAYLESTFPDVGVPLAQRVGELIRRLLPTGHYSADDVAEHLHLHRRTLQRRLLDEGVTYAAVLDQQRRDLAVRYLDEPGMQVGQVSALLGYAEQSVFNRAFRRWFGTSPREFRARAGERAEAPPTG